jgi:hypothetical protein
MHEQLSDPGMNLHNLLTRSSESSEGNSNFRLWLYHPSLWAACTITGFYGITTILHLIQAVRSKKVPTPALLEVVE